jgi:hypothetical protein
MKYIYEITADYTHMLSKNLLRINNRCIPQLGEVTYIDQGKDGQTNAHEDRIRQKMAYTLSMVVVVLAMMT